MVASARQQGFTLIEVLVALAITAFVAAAAYAGISAVLDGAGQLRSVAQRTEALERALGFLDRDLRQFVDRPVRDEFGEEQPALSGGPLAYFPLSLTRDGWYNTQQLPRSDLQRVHYYLEEGALWLRATDLPRALGFRLEDRGLCSGDVCVPLPADGGWLRERNGVTWFDATAFAASIDQGVAFEGATWSFGPAPPLRGRTLFDGVAPDFALEDREGRTIRLSDFRGSPVLLLTWASW